MFFHQFLRLVLVAFLVSNCLSANAQSAPSINDEWNPKAQVSDIEAQQIQNVLQKDPHNGEALSKLALYYAQHGYISLAEETYQWADKAAPDMPNGAIGMAKLLIATNHSDEASKVVDEALKRFPDDRQLLMTLGYLLSLQGKFDRAREIYLKAQGIDAHTPGGDSAMAQISLAQHKYEAAIKLAEMNLKKDPNSVPDNEVLASAWLSLKQPQKALGPLKRLYAQNPLSPRLAEALSLCLITMGRFNEAMPSELVDLAESVGSPGLPKKKKVLIILLNSVPAPVTIISMDRAAKILNGTKYGASYHFAMGDIFDQVGHPLWAIDQYRQGIALNPNYGRAYLRMGEDLEKFAEYDDALNFYTKAAQLAPADPEIQLHLARLSSRLKDRSNDCAWQLKDYLLKPHLVIKKS